MEPLYKPQGVEERWQRAWEDEGLYNAEADEPRETFVIALPPPNVTGGLHMGHALNGSIQDVLIRWHRMRGYNTLWQPGYDHAGISTQNVVEKQLAREGTSRQELGREAFVERVWDWLSEYGGKIMGQFRRIGASLDYPRERFTMDDGVRRGRSCASSSTSRKGLDLPRQPDHQLVPVPRDVALGPRGRARRDGRHAHLRPLPVRRRPGHVTIATVRPATILADVAVAVHPDDERYRDAVGKEVDRAVRRAARADHRRRARRARVRHRRAQGHARARPDGLRDRPRPRAARATVIGPDGRMNDDGRRASPG